MDKKKREREMGKLRDTNRRTNRQTETETEEGREGETDRQRQKERGKNTERDRNRDIRVNTEKGRKPEPGTETERIDRLTDRQTGKQRIKYKSTQKTRKKPWNSCQRNGVPYQCLISQFLLAGGKVARKLTIRVSRIYLFRLFFISPLFIFFFIEIRFL